MICCTPTIFFFLIGNTPASLDNAVELSGNAGSHHLFKEKLTKDHPLFFSGEGGQYPTRPYPYNNSTNNKRKQKYTHIQKYTNIQKKHSAALMRHPNSTPSVGWSHSRFPLPCAFHLFFGRNDRFCESDDRVPHRRRLQHAGNKVGRIVPFYLVRILRSYLEGRSLVTDNYNSIHEVTCGVLQGLVLGPTLWNVLYDGLLNKEVPEGVQLVGFADDLALVAVARTTPSLKTAVNATLKITEDWMEGHGLQLAR